MRYSKRTWTKHSLEGHNVHGKAALFGDLEGTKRISMFSP